MSVHLVRWCVVFAALVAVGCQDQSGWPTHADNLEHEPTRTLQQAGGIEDDTLPPLVLGFPETSAPGFEPGDPQTYPQAWTSDSLSIANLQAVDVGSGLVSISVKLNGLQTIMEANYQPAQTLPESGFTCTPGVCPEDGVTFAYSAMDEGPNCIELTAIDAAGNSTVRFNCFNLAVLDFSRVEMHAHEACTSVSAQMTPYLSSEDNDLKATANKAIAACATGIKCLESEQMGCYLMSMVNTHKLVLNTEVLSGAEHSELRQTLVESTEVALKYVKATWENNNPTSFQVGSDTLAQVSASANTSGAMGLMETAFFWFEDSRRPFPSLSTEELTCAALADLSAELGQYANDPAHLPAYEAIGEAKVRLDYIRYLLCETGLHEAESCYHRNFLVGLSGLMDFSSDLKNLRQGNDAGDAGTFVWTSNWQLGISRIAQFWLNKALDNFEQWVTVGGTAPNYEVIKAEADAAWGDAESLLEQGDLEEFIARFTSPEAKCRMYDAYEYIIAWWNDAANPECGPVPYPLSCFDDEGENEWPLHQVDVPGGFADVPVFDVPTTVTVNSAVRLTGLIVTAPTTNGFYAQSPAGGPDSGIFVFENRPPTVERGDEVTVEGIYTEAEQGMGSLTQLITPRIAVTSSNNIIVPDRIDIDSINEAWESVLVEVRDVAARSAPEASGQWAVEDASASQLMIDNQLHQYSRTISPDVAFASIVGVVNDFGDYSLEPRDDDDFTLAAIDTRNTEIQQGTVPVGSLVRPTVPSVVTAVASDGFYAQEPTGGPFSGIFVFTEVAPTVVQGDMVHLEGIYEEHPQNTGTLSRLEEATVAVLSSGHVVSPEVLGMNFISETWESVLVQVGPVTVVSSPNGEGLWQVNGSHILNIDDQLYMYSGDTSVGVRFQSIVGVVNDLGEFVLEGRQREDFTTVECFEDNDCSGAQVCTHGVCASCSLHAGGPGCAYTCPDNKLSYGGDAVDENCASGFCNDDRQGWWMCGSSSMTSVHDALGSLMVTEDGEWGLVGEVPSNGVNLPLLGERMCEHENCGVGWSLE